MHHSRVAVNVQEFSHLPAAGHGHASEVIACKINQHRVFRNLLLVCAHVQLVANIQFMVDAAIRVEPARTRPRDGIELDLPIFRREFEV